MRALMTAKHIIFVDNTNMLPPIGTGCPFVDPVELLRLNLNLGSFLRFCENYGKLTISRCQRSHSKHMELELSRAGAGDMPDSDAIAKIECGYPFNSARERNPS